MKTVADTYCADCNHCMISAYFVFVSVPYLNILEPDVQRIFENFGETWFNHWNLDELKTDYGKAYDKFLTRRK